MKSIRILQYLAIVIGVLAVVLTPITSSAQFFGTAPQNNLRDMSAIRLPAGNDVAIVVFEDLGCPACAHAHQIEIAAAKQAGVPLLRHDFPLPGHVWTFQGAVCARYIQDKISPQLADQFRSDVFAAQNSISSKEDIQRFMQAWLQRHGQQMPFMLDPSGSFAKAVQADYDLGLKINVQYTPTVIVVTKDKYQVVCGTKDGPNDPSQILPVAEAALSAAHTAHKNSVRSSIHRMQ